MISVPLRSTPGPLELTPGPFRPTPGPLRLTPGPLSANSGPPPDLGPADNMHRGPGQLRHSWTEESLTSGLPGGEKCSRAMIIAQSMTLNQVRVHYQGRGGSLLK